METVDQVSNNPALQDLINIKAKRPELSAEEWETVEKAADYYKALLKPEVRQDLELEYAKKYEEFVEQARTDAAAAVEVRFEEWKKSQEPLNTDELKKLISQEYEEFTIPIRYEKEGEIKTRHFVIKELPKSIEKRFVSLAQKTILPMLKASALEKFKWETLPSFEDKINTLLGLIPNSLDVMADICAICLDPFEKDKEVTGTWVSEHLSSARIQAIVLLQFEVNKYRDFFLSAFRLFQNLSGRKTM